jgi:hypothetical protein
MKVGPGILYVRLLNKNGNPVVEHAFATSAVRHVEAQISE